jgi:4-amino-4-deoxy-L-arabinose transferase-like glycosyltransferase
MRREATPALGIFALALALRALSLFQLRDIPAFDHLLIDARAYDQWARHLLEGAWWGDRVFYQAPAYPYFMALVYELPGDDLWTLRIAQALLGSLSCVAAFATARLLFDRKTGVVAGALLALYPPAIFFDAIVQKTSLGLFLTSALLLSLAALQRSRRWPLALLAGAAAGLLALTRENALVLLPLVPVWLLWRFRDAAPARRVGLVAAFAAGAAALLLPVGARNYAVGRTFAVTTSQLGTNFFYGNNPEATGLYVPLVPGRQTPEFESPDATRIAERERGRALTPGEVSDYWLERGLDFVRGQPLAWLRLMLWKGLLTWNRVEIPDTEDLGVYADWSWVLRALSPVLHFGLLVPLAAAGALFARRDPQRWRDSAPLLLLALVYSGAVALFLVAARFRFPLVPFLLPFAALALVQGVRSVREGRATALRGPLVAFLVAAGLCNLPLLDTRALRATSYANFGAIRLRERRLPEAERYLEKAASLHPADPDLQFDLGVLRSEQGRLAEAETHLRRALRMAPDDFRTHRVLAGILQQRGRPEEARRHRRIAARLDPSLNPPPERDR